MGTRVTLDPQGRLQAELPEKARALSQQAGTLRWFPGSADVLLMLREPAQGGAHGPRVALFGDIAVMPIPEVVEFLHQGRRSGVLRVLTPSADRSIVFGEGMVRGATSDQPSEGLGQVCVKLGLVRPADLERVVSTMTAPSPRLGRMLVEAGLLQSHDLFRAVQAQVTEVFGGILIERAGHFVLLDDAIEERSAGVTLNTQALLMDSIRRIDEMAQFRTRIPSASAYVVRRKPIGTDLEPEEQALFDAANGRKTLQVLSRELKLGEFEATKLVFHLLQGGYVALSETPAALEGRKEDPAEMARAFNVIFESIFSEMDGVGAREPFLLSANSALGSEQHRRTGILGGLNFADDGTLDTDRLLYNLVQLIPEPGGPTPTRRLHAALSEVMFFLLFQASELLDPASDERLAKRVKALLAEVDGR